MEDIEFLLQYAKVGILKTMENLDPIASEELKQEYLRIKRELTQIKKELTQKNITPSVPMERPKKEEQKPSAVKKWFSGIGDRQKKYKEAHEDDLI